MARAGLIPFTYFGGKASWVDQLYTYFPEHFHFVDVFCGSMAVTLNKPPSKMDTANDLDASVFTFFKVLREHPKQLMDQLFLTAVSRVEYDEAWPPFEEGLEDLEVARRFFVRCRMSFNASGMQKSTGFNACVTASERGKSKNVVKYFSSIDRLPEVVEKLRSIQVENLDYEKIIAKYDRPDTFFYCDPPYELRTRNYKKFYTNEFTDGDHRGLKEALRDIKGKAMVSHTDSKMYRQLYRDWNMISLVPKGHSLKKTKQKECVWVNY